MASCSLPFVFFLNAPATTEVYTLSLHDALPIWRSSTAVMLHRVGTNRRFPRRPSVPALNARPAGEPPVRSEEHTSELQSRRDLVCRLLLEKKKKKNTEQSTPYR